MSAHDDSMQDAEARGIAMASAQPKQQGRYFAYTSGKRAGRHLAIDLLRVGAMRWDDGDELQVWIGGTTVDAAFSDDPTVTVIDGPAARALWNAWLSYTGASNEAR